MEHIEQAAGAHEKDEPKKSNEEATAQNATKGPEWVFCLWYSFGYHLIRDPSPQGHFPHQASETYSRGRFND